MPYTIVTYVSDGDQWYASDQNTFIADNINYFSTYASSNARFDYVGYSSEIDLGSQATDFSVNFGNGNRQHATLTGNADITLLTSDLTGAGNYTLALDGNFTYAFSSDAVKSPGGVVSYTISSDDEEIVGLFYTDRDGLFRVIASSNIQ